ncbi:hypothetical protein WJX81_006220 [Elliptochloris bilobata]|uniref:Importin N-terminal domain-containing protein n=1 Tax=Elliptochloris bilobata TaxID=381761 RepID=A0AAW1RUK8_9CHLO
MGAAAQQPEIRQLAGVVLKNSVQSTAEAKNAELAQKWLATDEGMRAQIRQLLLATLPAEVQGMRKDELDSGVRLAATVALLNALEFAQTNFDNPDERNYLMQVICEGTIAPDARVRETAFECLVKIAANYYEKLPAYMQDIFTLTHRAAKEDEEDVGKQAIEFWCTICEEELDLQEESEEGDSAGAANHHVVKQALQPLVAMLLEQLVKQEEGQDRDDGAWNLAMAGGTCLTLVASVVGQDVIALVMPFVQVNIGKADSPEDWRLREAATFAFGSILDGPPPDKLAGLVAMGLPFLLNALKDPNTAVRHTTAWTIGRIFEFVHGPAVVNTQALPAVVGALLAAIRDEPHIAEKVCFALCQLAAGFKVSAPTSLLSPYFKDIVQALLEAAQRPVEGPEGTRLASQAFEAINEAVRSAAADTVPLVVQLIPLTLQKLNATLAMAAAAPDARERQSEMQGLLCGVLQVIVQRLSEADSNKAAVLQYADATMEALLAVFACRNATVHEEAMLAAGALTYTCGPQFVKYMERFFPVLQMGLTNHQEWQVCQVSVGVLGDVCRAIEILSAFGDIAIAIGDAFEAYLPHVLQMLQSAQALSVAQQSTGDEDAYEYNSLLRHGIFEAYSGILNGMSKDKSTQHMTQVAPSILEFEEFVASDKENQDDAVMRSAIALLGDLAANLPATGPLFQGKAWVTDLLGQARASGDSALIEQASWASSTIMALGR